MDPLTEEIMALWNEGLMPNTIAVKLGIALEVVEDIVEAPGNYALQFSDLG